MFDISDVSSGLKSVLSKANDKLSLKSMAEKFNSYVRNYKR